MLRSLKQILGYRLLSEDDEFGKAKDFLFHEEEWNIRYLVADTGDWLPDRKVGTRSTELG